MIGVGLANASSLTILKPILYFRPFYVFNFRLYTVRIDRSGKSHKIIDEGVIIVDAENGKIINGKYLATPKNYDLYFFSKMFQKPKDAEGALSDIEEMVTFRDVIRIKPEFRFNTDRTSRADIKVVEAKLPLKAAKSMILDEIVEDNIQDVSFKMKLANGTTEDREMRIIPKYNEISLSRASLIRIPKWEVNFKAKGVTYTRKTMAASNTKLMDELEFCPRHFSRWKVWQRRKLTYAICDSCGSAFCEDHIRKINEVYLCDDHINSLHDV